MIESSRPTRSTRTPGGDRLTSADGDGAHRAPSLPAVFLRVIPSRPLHSGMLSSGFGGNGSELIAARITTVPFLKLGQVSLRPTQRLVRAEGLSGHLMGATGILPTDHPNDRVVVAQVRTGCRYRIGGAACAQCDAPGHPRMRLGGQPENVLELVQQRARRRDRLGAHAGNARQRTSDLRLDTCRCQVLDHRTVVRDEAACRFQRI